MTLPSRRRLWIFGTLYVVALLGLSEIAARAVLPPPGFNPWPPAHVPGLRVPHPVLGFAHRPNFTGQRTTAEYTHELATNALGMRDSPFVPGDERPWLAIGDSFTEGLGVGQDEAWPTQLAQRLGTRVLNGGVTAYSLRQMRLAAMEWLPIVQPRGVIVGLYPLGASRLIDPYVLVGDDTVRQSVASRLSPLPGGYYDSGFYQPGVMTLHRWLSEHAQLAAHVLTLLQRARTAIAPEVAPPAPLEPTLTTALLDELEQTYRVLRASHVTLVILLVNAPGRDGRWPTLSELPERLAAFAERPGVLFVDPEPTLRDAMASGLPIAYVRDGHWTASGHRLVAEVLAARLR